MTPVSTIKVLVIEDNPGDFILVQEYLAVPHYHFEVVQADRLAESIRLVKAGDFDVILLDLSLPDSRGLDGVRILQTHTRDTPIIVLTGFGNEQYGIDSLKLGAEDYLLKDDINSSLLVKTILYSMERARLRREMDRQDRLFRVITENSRDVKTITRPDGTILYVSSSLQTVLGYDPAECIGRNEKDFIHPDDLARQFRLIGQVIEHPQDQPTFELRVMHANGTYRWCEKTIQNLLDDAYVQGIVCTFRDISDRKAISEKVASSERRLASLVRSGSDLIWVMDLLGNLGYVSPTASKILGLEPESLLGRNAFEFVHPGDIDRIREEFGRIQTREAIRMSPFRFRDGRGNWRWIDSEVTNLLADPAVGGIVINSRDITEKRLAEEELRKLSLIARETINAVVITDAAGKITWVNDSFTTITGYGFSEAVGHEPGALLQGPDSDPAVIRLMSERVRDRKPFEVEIINYHRNGGKYWIQIQCQPLFDAQGNLTHFFAIETDITERKQSEERLRASEEQYRSLFDLSPASIIVWDPETLRVLEVNETAEKEYGYSKEEFKRLSVLDFREEEEAPRIQTLARAFSRQERVYARGIWNHRNREGELMKMDYVSHLIWYNGRRAILAHGQNVTEKLQLERALEEERQQRQLEITDAVISAQEREREEIGRELHDNVNQILASSRLYLGLVRRLDAQALKYLEETDKLINQGISEIRNLSHALIPSAIYETSLTDQLDMLAAGLGPAGIQVVRDYAILEDAVLSGKLKLSIYRIVQEQINNILKYAQARTVTLHLSLQGTTLLLQISDDGVGFDPAVKGDGVGLMNIRTRASLFNGQVSILSSPGNGCLLRIAFQLT